MLVTLCTIRQLPQAFALGDSFIQYATEAGRPAPRVVIGLADDPAHMPAGLVSPHELLPLADLLPPDQLAHLSARYTPTELAAACKPLLIRAVLERFPAINELVYADANIRFYDRLTPLWQELATANILLTPYITHAPADGAWPGQAWPDEKFFQNIGLYSADFLAFRRSGETSRMLAWWQDRVTERAYINFCEGLCTDQLWLMHVPVFFGNVKIVKNPAWHVALWNLPYRTLRQTADGWQLSETGQPLLFANMKGLHKPDEGFFPYQNRLLPARRADVTALLTYYRQALAPFANPALDDVRPAYGQQPEPVVVRGWRRAAANALRRVTRFIDQVPLPAIR